MIYKRPPQANYKAYLIRAFEQALLETTLPQPPGAPVVAPEDEALFPDKIERALHRYIDQARLVEDFEAWMKLLEYVALEEGLSDSDYPDIAAELNRFRVEVELPPL